MTPPLTTRHAEVDVGRFAAVAALLALLTGGTLMAATGPLVAAAGADVWRPVRENPGLFLSAAIALALISLFDLFTIPALHVLLHRRHPRLVLVAAVTAAIGDLLGVLSRLVRCRLPSRPPRGPTCSRSSSPPQPGRIRPGQRLFASFGLAMLGDDGRMVGDRRVAGGSLHGRRPATRARRRVLCREPYVRRLVRGVGDHLAPSG